MDDLSQEPSPLAYREGKLSHDTIPSVKVEESSHSIVVKTSEIVNSSNESQGLPFVKVPKGDDIESTDFSITESQFSSTMPYCEESIVAKLDPLGEGQFLSAQPCHMEETTLPHEGANLVAEEGLQMIKNSGTSASKIPTEVTNVKFDSVSDINTESQVDHGLLQSCEISNVESIEPSEPSPSPVKVRRSTRSTKGIPSTRYGSVTSHRVNVPSKFGKWLSSISKKKLIPLVITYLTDIIHCCI